MKTFDTFVGLENARQGQSSGLVEKASGLRRNGCNFCFGEDLFETAKGRKVCINAVVHAFCSVRHSIECAVREQYL